MCFLDCPWRCADPVGWAHAQKPMGSVSPNVALKGSYNRRRARQWAATCKAHCRPLGILSFTADAGSIILSLCPKVVQTGDGGKANARNPLYRANRDRNP